MYNRQGASCSLDCVDCYQNYVNHGISLGGLKAGSLSSRASLLSRLNSLIGTASLTVVNLTFKLIDRRSALVTSSVFSNMTKKQN